MRLLFLFSCLLLASSSYGQQQYPNITGETLLEDERVVVQRFVLDPGQWEGIHEHPEYQLVIVLNSSDELTYRAKGNDVIISQNEADGPDGMSSFWRPGPVPISDQHETGNTGSRPLEWIAITFKGDSITSVNPSSSNFPPDDE